MTVIVGVETEGDVIIGADSFWGNRSWAHRSADGKHFRLGTNGDGMLFATSGSVRVKQLLRYRLELPEHEENVSDAEFLATELVDQIREVLKEGGALREEHEIQRISDWSGFLAAYNGKLYSVHDDLQVTRTRDGYASVGAGRDFALGAMAVQENIVPGGMNPVERIYNAMRAAARHSPYVVPPFTVQKLNDVDYEERFDK